MTPCRASTLLAGTHCIFLLVLAEQPWLGKDATLLDSIKVFST